MTEATAVDLSTTLGSLMRDREQQEKVVAYEQGKLMQIDNAIRSLQASHFDVDNETARRDLAGKGIIESALILLAEQDGQDTSELAKQMKLRGTHSKSLNLSAAVFATLNHATTKGGAKTPKFIRKDDRWYLAKLSVKRGGRA